MKIKVLPALILISAFSVRGFAQETEKSVAFKTADGKYITTAPSSMLDLSGVKVGSKQIFTLIDVNGGELADGDDVKIKYSPNAAAGATPPNPNYWREAKDVFKRGGEASVFKIKKVETKFAFQSPAGKFVAAPVTAGPLIFADKQEGALMVEIVPAAAAPKKAADPAKPAEPAKSASDSTNVD